MSQKPNQIAQYKNATKLLNKKCQALEAQLTETKANWESQQKALVTFLEYVSSPFSDTNVAPELTFDSLKVWWDEHKRSPEETTTNPQESQVIVTDSGSEELKKEIEQLTTSLKEMEIEKNNAEYTLSRRQDDYMALNESMLELKKQLEDKENEIKQTASENRKVSSQLISIHDNIASIVLYLSELVTMKAESYDEKKQSIVDLSNSLFEDCSDELQTKNKEAITSLVDQILLLKDASEGVQVSLSKHQELTDKQENYIKQMEQTIENNKSEFEKLQRKINKLESSLGDEEDDLNEELDDLEEENANLKQALLNAKDNMEQQIQKQQQYEMQCLKLQEEIVTIQQTSNEMVQQAFATSEAKQNELKAQLKEVSTELENKEDEMMVLKEQYEASTSEYEQELAVLRARKIAVEQQVTVSEKFLDDHNKLYQVEIAKLQHNLQDATEETQELRCQVLEKEAEIESMQQKNEETIEQLHNQVDSLNEQLRSMQGKLANQQNSVVSSKKREIEVENEMKKKLEISIQEMEEKDKEIIKQQQKNYEDELKRIREQVGILTHQLEEERKNTKKMRETVAQLNEIFESQDRQIEILRSDITIKDSELLAGKEQIRKLSMLVSSHMATQQ